MAQYGGKRGQATEAEIVARGGEKVADLTAQGGAAAGAKYGALGGAIGGTLGIVGEGLATDRRAAEARAFEERKIGAGMAHEQGMQREKILGESALQGQQIEGRQQQLQQELQARKQEHAEQREFEAASEGKVTYDKSTGKYAPSPLATQQRQADLSLTRAKGMDVFNEVAMKREQLQNNMAIARMKTGQEAMELEEKAKQSAIGHIEKLAELERQARTDVLKASSGAGALMPGQKGPQELSQYAEQLKTARNLQAFTLASETGDTSYIVPGSREQQIMTNRWIPQVRGYLENNPMMTQLSLQKGPSWGARMVNRIAAQLTMMELADPDLAAAAAKAFQPGAGPQEQAGGSRPSGPASQSARPGSQPGGVSIPR